VAPIFLENLWAPPEDGDTKILPECHESTQHHIAEDWNLHWHCYENLRSQKSSCFCHVSMPSLCDTVTKRELLCVILVLQEYALQLTQCLQVAVKYWKMAAFGCGAREHMKTLVTFDVLWTFMQFIKQCDQLPEFESCILMFSL
jgi:hypothetical protein